MHYKQLYLRTSLIFNYITSLLRYFFRMIYLGIDYLIVSKLENFKCGINLQSLKFFKCFSSNITYKIAAIK